MPHQCTNCDHTFPDGSKQMLSGCPECGGNKFQFLPASAVDRDDAEPRSDRRRDDSSPDRSGPGDPDDIIEAPSDPEAVQPSGEDRAQASARRTFVSEDELPSPDQRDPEVDAASSGSTADPPDISELREELNQQFESIKILQPGEYELNLMELYDREERIIALEEDGRYVIDVPSSWTADEE